MPKAYSYIRFSTPEQAKGDSLRRQLSQAFEWCQQPQQITRDLVLDDTIALRDLGVSAFNGDNRTTGALKTFLELVEAGKIERGSYLIVESLDRLSREAVIDAAARLFDLIRAGITVVTLSDGHEYSPERLRNDWTPLIVSLAVMARAHDESRMKSERVGKAWKQKKALARDEGKPLTKRCPEWLAIDGGKFVYRPERVEIVRRVFRETIEGAGRREIVRRLNQEGIPAFRGKNGWHASSIAKILESRAVLGEYQPHKGPHRQGNRQPDGDPILNFYPAVVDETTFWRAQAATKGRRKNAAGRKGNTVHLFQGIACCASCGGPMHVVNKGASPKGGIYLACDRNKRSAGCDNARRWRVDVLEHYMLTGLSFLDPRTFDSLDDDSASAAEEVVALKAQIEAKTATRKRLLRLVEATEDDEAEESYKVVSAEIKALRKGLKEAEAAAAKGAADLGLSERLRDAVVLSRQIEDADQEERRSLRIRLLEILRALVDRIECGEETGAIMVLKPRRGEGFYLKGMVPFGFWMETAPGSTAENPAVQFRMLLESKDDKALRSFVPFAFDDE